MNADTPLPDGMLTLEQKEDYRQALQALHADQPCGRCGSSFDRFGVLPASTSMNFFRIDEAIHGVQELRADLIALACLNCGAIYQHLQPVLNAELNRGTPATGATDA